MLFGLPIASETLPQKLQHHKVVIFLPKISSWEYSHNFRAALLKKITPLLLLNLRIEPKNWPNVSLNPVDLGDLNNPLKKLNINYFNHPGLNDGIRIYNHMFILDPLKASARQ